MNFLLSIVGLDGVHPANKKLKKELQSLASLANVPRMVKSESAAKKALTELQTSLLNDDDPAAFKKYVIQLMEIIIDAGCGGDMMKGKKFKEVDLNDPFCKRQMRITCETVVDSKGKNMQHHQTTTRTKRAGVEAQRTENIVFVWEIPDVSKLFELLVELLCRISAVRYLKVCSVHEPFVRQVQ